jgi:hypothetical protein
MAGSGFLVVTQLATLSELSLAHHLAIACFVVCIPLALSAAFWPHPPLEKLRTLGKAAYIITIYVALFAFGVGILSFFASFGKDYALLLGTSVISALVLVMVAAFSVYRSR